MMNFSILTNFDDFHFQSYNNLFLILGKKKETPWIRKFYRHVYELFPNKLPTQQLELM
jgi:hypothetical protein